MRTNADITIYNYWYNPKTKKMEYRGTKIAEVHWYMEQKIALVDKGIVSADVYKIRIPIHAKIQDNRIYMDPKSFSVLSQLEIDKYWTVDIEDIFVKGLIDDEVEKLSDLKIKHSCVGKINGYSDNRFGYNPHIRIGGA